MSNSSDRFYLLEMRNRPAVYGDVGSLLKIEGIVVGGSGASVVLLLPSAGDSDIERVPYVLSDSEWSDFIRRSDDPEILTGGPDGNTPKIFQRKLRYEISGAVQQKVWAVDGFKCMYCGAKMGQSLMTIDHLIPLELGGENDVTNYLTSCKKCNKDKGSEDPRTWCARRGYSFEGLKRYLANRQIR